MTIDHFFPTVEALPKNGDDLENIDTREEEHSRISRRLFLNDEFKNLLCSGKTCL